MPTFTTDAGTVLTTESQRRFQIVRTSIVTGRQDIIARASDEATAYHRRDALTKQYPAWTYEVYDLADDDEDDDEEFDLPVNACGFCGKRPATPPDTACSRCA